ncbi:MAG: hypothetical protein MUC61_03300 [Amoebophilaceae bacterium]|jgi:hypothetical protein|nr:hypothetical protein [Amoebophilaceae bacterium]
MEGNPEEILERKLNNPKAILTPDQSISLINYCTELGEQHAAHTAEKTISIFAGNIGAGKSTTINALLGCRMRAEFDDETDEEIIIVDPSSPFEEFMPIGHGRRSRTFMPQIAQDPDHPNRAYCDCPGFYNTMGAEINIANAINMRKVLQQATGVKVVFLAEYDALLCNRGYHIRNLEAMCGKMFGGADNLRRYQNSVLLGITKAPLCVRDRPLTTNAVRERLKLVGSDVAAILANRVFLFDPLDHATDNLDFWDRDQLRTVISQLRHIPQQQAVHLFQTTLTDSDKSHLLATVQRLRPRMLSAIEQDDATALGQYWQLLQRLRVMEHPEVN